MQNRSRRILHYLFTFTICSFSAFCHAKRVEISVQHAEAPLLKHYVALPITLEIASSKDEITWGLMQRTFLPPDHGMLLQYLDTRRIILWMFNVPIDLSVAIIDSRHVILETHEMRAHMGKMDPSRPVNSVKDMYLYPPSDPIVHFFQRESLVAENLGKYALEMNAHWFERNEVHPGDILEWEEKAGRGWVIPTKDISQLYPSREVPILVTLKTPSALSLCLAKDDRSRDILFLDDEQRIVKAGTLIKGKSLYSKNPCKFMLVTTPGWITQNEIQLNDKIIFMR